MKYIDKSIKSARTLSLMDSALSATQALVSAVSADESYSSVTEKAKSARTAVRKMVASHQTDAIAGIVNFYPTSALQALCTLGMFSAYSFPAKESVVSAKENGQAVLFDLSSAIPAFNAAGITSISPSWQSDVLDAVKICAIVHICDLKRQGKSVCSAETYGKLNASDSVAKVCKKSDGSISAKLDDAKKLLQSAVNTIFGMTDAGKPRYYVKSADVRAIIAQFGWNDAKNAIVIPRDENKIRFFFNMLRAIVGGTEYSVIIEQEKKNQEEEDAE